MVRYVRSLSPVAKSLEAKHKARAALEAWLKGMTQGGHTPSEEDIAETYRIVLAHYQEAP